MLQYKVGNKVVVLDPRSTPYVKGDIVTIKELCDNGTEDEHYCIDGNKGKWWVQECYLNPLIMQNNLRPFDLATALAGKLVVTRDGRKVTEIIKTNAPVECNVIGYIDGEPQLDTFNANGKWYSEGHQSDSDLFMAPVQVTKWVNVYKRDDIVTHNATYDTKEDAERAIAKMVGEIYISTVPITFTV